MWTAAQRLACRLCRRSMPGGVRVSYGPRAALKGCTTGYLESPRLLRQTKCYQLARVVSTADRHDDVLPAVEHVGHRRPALRRRHVDSADFGAARLVVRAQHRAAGPGRRRRDARLA